MINHTTKHQNITELLNTQLERDIAEMNDMFDRYGYRARTRYAHVRRVRWSNA